MCLAGTARSRWPGVGGASLDSPQPPFLVLVAACKDISILNMVSVFDAQVRVKPVLNFQETVLGLGLGGFRGEGVVPPRAGLLFATRWVTRKSDHLLRPALC
jgi:hypothetical protein